MKVQHLVSIGSIAFLLAGCGAPNPATLAIEERDRAFYVDQGAEAKLKEEKFSVAVLVSEQNLKGAAKTVAPAIDSQLCSVINDMAFFQLVERSNADALMREKALSELGEEGGNVTEDFAFPEADYLITAKVSSIQSDPEVKTSIYTDNTGHRYVSETSSVTVSVAVDFRFYEIATQRLLVSKDITTKSYTFTSSGATFTDQAAIDKRVARVAKEAVKSFAMELGARYAPKGRVIETRGNCLVAKINQGSNYGIVPGVKVEFYEIVDNSAIDPDLKRDENIIGRGAVFQSDLRSAWVKVDDYTDVHVKKGDYVKISSDQSKGFMENFNLQMTEGLEDVQ